MSGKTNGDSPNRSRTLIAAGMRIDGKVDFTGTLLVRGEVRGEVSSPDGAAGVIVVDSTGSVTGSLAVPRIVVRGRVAGPMDSSQSIEIHAGGSAAGDLRYRALTVQAGGVVDGLLTYTAAAADQRAQPRAAAANDGTTANAEALAASIGAPLAEQPRSANRGMVVGVIAVLAGVPLVFWLAQRTPAPRTVAASEPVPVAAPAVTERMAADAAPARATAEAAPARSASEAAEPRERPAPAPRGGNQPASRATPAAAAASATAGTTPPPAARAEARGDEASTERPEPDIAQAVAFSGINPARPAGLLFVVTRAPAVVYKKKPEDRSLGTRLAFGNNRNTSIRVSPDEVVRVAEGEAIDLYYQGVRVPAQTVDSGAWMRFVPLPPPTATREPDAAAQPAPGENAGAEGQPSGAAADGRAL